MPSLAMPCQPHLTGHFPPALSQEKSKRSNKQRTAVRVSAYLMGLNDMLWLSNKTTGIIREMVKCRIIMDSNDQKLQLQMQWWTHLLTVVLLAKQVLRKIWMAANAWKLGLCILNCFHEEAKPYSVGLFSSLLGHIFVFLLSCSCCLTVLLQTHYGSMWG